MYLIYIRGTVLLLSLLGHLTADTLGWLLWPSDTMSDGDIFFGGHVNVFQRLVRVVVRL
jgi:hypothetical protein